MAALHDEVGGGGVVFVGDDRTDEEVFVALGDRGCSIRVGPGPTAARFRLAGPPDVLDFLHALTRVLATTRPSV
jgi:trehalose-6-phosphatase